MTIYTGEQEWAPVRLKSHSHIIGNLKSGRGQYAGRELEHTHWIRYQPDNRVLYLSQISDTAAKKDGYHRHIVMCGINEATPEDLE